MKKMRYAIKRSNCTSVGNYGDYIQEKAIENVYRYMGIPINELVEISEYEFLHYDGDEQLIVPINSPFQGVYEKLSDNIIPVYLGVSIMDYYEDAISGLRFRDYEPVGCRDQRTYTLLKKAGIECYLNGCMTMALPARLPSRSADKVFFIDCCNELESYIPGNLKRNSVYTSQLAFDTNSNDFYTEAAKRYEEICKNARMVVTSRLHIASPCLALGIPVIFAMQYIPHRCTFLHKYIPLYTIDKFCEINWRPEPVDCEQIKPLLLSNAADRLRQVYNSNLCQILTEYYFDPEDSYVREDLLIPIKWIENNWPDRSACYHYTFWGGGSQTMYSLYDYICSNYPNARLDMIIDRYRSISFHGIHSVFPDEVKAVARDSVVFVTAVRALKDAREYLFSKGHSNVVDCWNVEETTFHK